MHKIYQKKIKKKRIIQVIKKLKLMIKFYNQKIHS